MFSNHNNPPAGSWASAVTACGLILVAAACDARKSAGGRGGEAGPPGPATAAADTRPAGGPATGGNRAGAEPPSDSRQSAEAVAERTQRASSDNARIRVSQLGQAVAAFEIDVGRLPTTDEGLSSLLRPPANVNGWRGPYLARGGVEALVDAWGRPYFYRAPGRHNPQEFDVGSAGPDGKEGTADDVGNW